MVLVSALPAAASDVDLGDPQTLEELLASPEYLDDEHADVARLYQAFFNRVPDVGGLTYWIDIYEDGTPLDELAWLFSNSAEFQQTYGTELTDEQFLEIVYANVLGRDYDQKGFDYWLGEMRNGLLRHQAVFYIVAGQEFIAEYPFAGTAPDYRSTQISPADVWDLRPDYSQVERARYSLTEAEMLDLHPCVQLRILSTNTHQVFLGRPDGAGFVAQDQYAFSNVADAGQAMDNHRQLTADCPVRTETFENGSVLTRRYQDRTDNLNVIGDDHMVISALWQWENGPSYEFWLYVVRDANVVTVTDVTARNGTAYEGEALRWSELTSERLRELLELPPPTG